jgi:UDP-N-acetylmuramoylalanine--D-glutamate ligase
VSANHLDRHPSLEAYAAIKARIWKNAGADEWTVFNRDDLTVSKLAMAAPGKKISFGKGTPPDAGAGFAWEPRQAHVMVRLPGASLETYDLAKFPAPGAHNASNASCAILLARLAGATSDAIGPALASFVPLEHRLEKCGEKQGIVFYNDSKATTSEALAKSLEVFDANVVLLAGGKDKGGDFRALRSLVQSRVKKAVTFGTHKDLIADALAGTTIVVRTPDLTAAFSEATKDLAKGDVVLFSPACASYDQFANFEERGRKFKALVKEWIA